MGLKPIGGKRQVGYWLGRDYWSWGITTEALHAFLTQELTCSLYAHVAKHNVASLRVLEKSGFVIIREEQGFPDADGHDVAEFVLQLSGNSLKEIR